MIKTLRFLKPYWKLIVLLVILTTIQVTANLQLPDYLSRIVSEGIVKEDQALIISIGLQMLVVALIGGISTIGVGFLASKIGTGFSRDARKELFSKIQSFSLAEFNKFSTSSLITRSTNDVQQVQLVLILVFRMILSAPITAIGAIIKANNIAPSMSWIMAVAVIALVTVITLLFVVAIPKFQILQKLTDKLNLVSRENLTGIRVIRAFNTEKTEEKKFKDVNADLTSTNLFVTRATSLLQPAMFLILNLATVGIIWVGSHLIATNDLQIGNMLAFMQYAVQVIVSFLLISIVFILVPRALVSARRIEEVLDTDLNIVDPDEEEKPKKKNGLVEFKDVAFSYNNADAAVINNITFTAEPGKTTAFIGSTGSGKSTLINLIPRFYDPTFGNILIDGVDIKDIKQEEIHAKIGYVSQKAVLFSGTIESNIKYGKTDATDKEMEDAAEIAQAADFVNQLSDKFKTPVSQDGTNLSGGQKQRVSIARAVLKNPEIFIFDDSFSALDFKTDAKLREALFERTKGKTVLIVAQRINTIMHADKIIVLDEGKIVGMGTHDELMKSSKVYSEIAHSQLSDEELKEN
ncbi:MAG: ABC transporter ATP-binding protein [Candidatus Dojkabacteria bacterium]